VKTQVSFFIKVLFIVISTLIFAFYIILFSSFQKEAVKEKERADFEMEVLNVLQKLVNNKECLLAENESKGVIDVSKIEKFAQLYNEIEPISAENYDFDYRVKVLQFPKVVNFSHTLTIVECKEDCYHRGYNCKIICHRTCKEKKVHTIITRSFLDEKVWYFGVPENSFSPQKAMKSEIQLSIPVSIKYNETLITEGMIYIHAVKGELEKLHGLISYLCRLAEQHPEKDIRFGREFSFSFKVEMRDDRVCMLEKCKKIVCSFPIEFKGFDKGEYLLNFLYDSAFRKIYIQ